MQKNSSDVDLMRDVVWNLPWRACSPDIHRYANRNAEALDLQLTKVELFEIDSYARRTRVERQDVGRHSNY